MIDYDSFSRCHLTDIFFRFSRGSKRLKPLLQGCQTHSVLRAAFIHLDFIGPESDEKNFNQARLYISSPQTFLFIGTGNLLIKFRAQQPSKSISNDGEWHYLEITTSPSNDLRKLYDVARNGADLKK